MNALEVDHDKALKAMRASLLACTHGRAPIGACLCPIHHRLQQTGEGCKLCSKRAIFGQTAKRAKCQLSAARLQQVPRNVHMPIQMTMYKSISVSVHLSINVPTGIPVYVTYVCLSKCLFVCVGEGGGGWPVPMHMFALLSMHMQLLLSFICNVCMCRATHKSIRNHQQYVHVWRFVCAHVHTHAYAHFCKCVRTQERPPPSGLAENEAESQCPVPQPAECVFFQIGMQQAHITTK